MSKGFLGGLFGKENEAPNESLEPIAPASRSGEASTLSAAAPLGETRRDLFARLASGLSKSTARITDGVTAIFTKRKLDAVTLGELEDHLIASDLGVTVAERVIGALSVERFEKEVDDETVRSALAKIVEEILGPLEKPFEAKNGLKPHVVLVIGVNGAGKTTTIGKLAARFRGQGLSVVLAACDTFRAAAVDQLSIWGARVGASVVTRPIGSDAAGLAYEALQRARAEGADVLLIDTAGRLQNRRELMDELAKVVRVLKKLDPEAPHDTLLVLDATVGQNAISQTEAFREIAGVTGIVMTKLDGTARGGVLVALGEKFRIPIQMIGVGEMVGDLQPFKADAFARALAGLEGDRHV